MRKIVYVSGTRADFGLMRSTLQRIESATSLSLSVVATGMHLVPSYGDTWHEIEAAGLRLAARVPVEISPATGATMTRAIGQMTTAFADVFESEAPDIVLVLGDRGEMLAAAIAAIHLNIPVAHIHGGERSGTVDESVRHAITKLSHIHFAATDQARERLIALGERPDCVHVSGAPGLDGLDVTPRRARNEVFADLGFDTERPVALLLFHPVLQEAAEAANKTRAVLDGLIQARWQAVVLMPNADAGSGQIRAVYENDVSSDFRKYVHLPRADFIEIMAAADAMVGNSSSGIIEAASFGTPVLNLGSRQNLRERNANVIDLPEDTARIADALTGLAGRPRPAPCNVYGDGHAGERIVAQLEAQRLDAELLNKVLIY
ncbi:UDP-N-acetylglucosamine 2-epimerase (hydrolyzing) [Meridianimarinicoccus aquatilis]|uniref:UDP-N-acetylglucosamine 2-epimerase (Hydrolyzing) n=2 Tax=Meridianimarinicoccus aquatilis TaxID=2552766 RepID=A0A4R6AWV3_9RHOB|nr:UDP-N-acetylglucosamine 2-epimerase (hydrolyzing) [Fluviibacterium aquatile]